MKGLVATAVRSEGGRICRREKEPALGRDGCVLCNGGAGQRPWSVSERSSNGVC